MRLIKNYLIDQPIRFKMFYAYSIIVVMTVFLVGFTVYLQVSETIKENIENLLSNSTSVSLKVVERTAQASIRNYLRAVSEKNLQIVERLYQDVQAKQLTKQEAIARLRQILFSQTIGETGYIFCLDSEGKAVLHPNASVEGQNYAQFEFIQEQMVRRQGYLEYMWKNPGEKEPRAKALYMSYFEPWDWIISVSSYRSEFSQLINISDFKDAIFSQTFGKTGYSYVLNSKGDIVIHPYLSGNLIDAQDSEGKYLVRQQIRSKNGKMFYTWKNPGEDRFRDKMVIYNYIKEYDWIVASTSYIEEFYAPINSARTIFFATIAIILVVVLPVTFIISRGITQPLEDLERKFFQGAEGNLTGRVDVQANDEIGKLGTYFNYFMNKLEQFNHKIQKEIEERKKTEELFAKAFHGSPSGIFIARLIDYRFLDANPAFLTFIGLSQKEIINKTLLDAPKFIGEEKFYQIVEMLEQQGRIRNLDIEIEDAGQLPKMGIINVETVSIWGEKCILCSIEDLTKTKRLEREIIEISESERRQLGQYLHDDLKSHLLGIEVMQKVLHQKLAKFNYGDLASIARQRDLVQEAIQKIDRISYGLSPTKVAGHSLNLVLEELCRDIEQIYEVTCRLQIKQTDLNLDSRKAEHVYYIAREAAFNAVKHGSATMINLNVFRKERSVLLQLNDDGCGLPEDFNNRGLGIGIMNYRAKRIGGILNISNKKQAGTQVSLTFNP